MHLPVKTRQAAAQAAVVTATVSLVSSAAVACANPNDRTAMPAQSKNSAKAHTAATDIAVTGPLGIVVRKTSTVMTEMCAPMTAALWNPNVASLQIPPSVHRQAAVV